MNTENKITYEIARSYVAKGWPVFPVRLSLDDKGKVLKKPLVPWRAYEERLPTDEELHKWFDQGNHNGLGMATGKLPRIIVVDSDTIFDKLDSPVVARTVSGGKHYYFRWTKELRNDVKIEGQPLDFRGDGGFVVLPPSFYGDNAYTWEKEADTMFLKPLPDEIEKRLSTKPSISERKPVMKQGDDLPGASDGKRNHIAAQVAGIIAAGMNPKLWDSVGWPAFVEWNRTHVTPPLEERELRTTWESITRTDAQNHPVVAPQPEGKTIKTALKKISNQEKTKLALDVEGVVDILDAGDRLVYLTSAGETVDSATVDGVTYTPPAKFEVPYLFADKGTVLRLISDSSDSSDSSLYVHLLDYHKRISDLPHELFYDLLVLWDVHTYLQEKIHFSPILYLYAVKERGKSRTGKGCLYVARRGVFTETVREPDIIRWGNDHRAALGFDTKDFPKKIERANCDDLILARFEKGSTSSRTLWPDKGAFRDTKMFKLFGPTIVMTNRPVDDILESRSISIDMKPSVRQFNDPVLPEDALELKARLTAFRFRHQDTPLREVTKPAPGRFGDILSPLDAISQTFFPSDSCQVRKRELFEFLINKKNEEALDTFEARIVEAVLSAEPKVEEGFLPVEVVASIFNEGKGEKFVVRNETIGRVLRGLGFASRRTTSGQRGIYYDSELVGNVASQYGLCGSTPKLLSLPSLPTEIEAAPDNEFENFELGGEAL